MPILRSSACLIAGGAWLLSVLPAQAALGGAYASVEQDRAHMAARMLSTTRATHAAHSLTLANGDIVREFVSRDGSVFAIAWQGAARPDLRQLLGSRFDTLQADTAAPHARRSRIPLAVNRADFVVHSGGHSGAFWGVAYLPQAVPDGFTADDLQMDKAQ